MGTLRRTASLDGSLHFGRYSDWGKLWGLFCHWRRGKVNGYFGWCFFDPSQNNVRKLDDAPPNFLINVRSTRNIDVQVRRVNDSIDMKSRTG